MAPYQLPPNQWVCSSTLSQVLCSAIIITAFTFAECHNDSGEGNGLWLQRALSVNFHHSHFSERYSYSYIGWKSTLSAILESHVEKFSNRKSYLQFFTQQLFPYISYTQSSFANILPFNWFTLANLPMFYHSKAFPRMLTND